MAVRIALAGNPNSGKTTLFNALTGSNQFVGNWPGVTVEKKEGKLKKHDGVIITDYGPSRYLFAVPLYTGGGRRPQLSDRGEAGCDPEYHRRHESGEESVSDNTVGRARHSCGPGCEYV